MSLLAINVPLVSPSTVKVTLTTKVGLPFQILKELSIKRIYTYEPILVEVKPLLFNDLPLT